MSDKYFDLDCAPTSLIESYNSLARLIAHEYTGGQLKSDVENTRRDYCGSETATLIYDLFRDEIHKMVDVNEVSEWAEKDENYTERVAEMMVNEFIAKKSEDIYEEHKKEIDKNPNKKVADFVYADDLDHGR